MRGTNGQIRAQDTIAPGNDPREATRIASAEGPAGRRRGPPTGGGAH